MAAPTPAAWGADVPRYDIGAIPDQTVYVGYSCRFDLYSSALGDGAVFTVWAEPVPSGAFILDPAAGTFEYIPVAEDRKPFDITFKATKGGASVSQTLLFEPLAELPAEADIISYVRALPDPTSQTEVIESDIIEDVELNHVSYPQVTTGGTLYAKRVSISGKTVLFDKNIGPLYNYNEREDIKEMIISAETVIIRDPLHLPQTDVTINARKLRLEDREGAGPDELASLITTPTPNPTPARSAEYTGGEPDDGEQGLTGGSVTANIAEFFSLGSDGLPVTAPRFDLTGGEGQTGGAGKPGTHGRDIASVGPYVNLDIFQPYHDILLPSGFSQALVPNVTYYEEDQDWTTIFCSDEYSRRGNANDWKPGNGADGTADGKPGIGGSGGLFHASLDLADYADLDGGPAAPIGTVQPGGAAGTPCPAWKLVGWTLYSCLFYDIMEGTFTASSEVYTSQPGAEAPPPEADRPFGDPGLFEPAGSTTGWMTPAGVRATLLDIKDTYLNGHIEEARATLAEYLEFLNGVEPSTSEDASDFEQLRQEMEVLYHRASNNLDYFGNPAGWVPMLSFEANLAAFQNEVDDAIEVLYATYWLNSKAEETLDKGTAMLYAKGKLKNELGELIDGYADAQAALPNLVVEAENITARIETLTEELKIIEEKLLAQAEENLEPPWWQKPLRVVGAALKMIPAYQPVLGAIGGGFNILAQVDSETSVDDLDSLLTAGEFAYTFKQADMVKKSDAVNRKLKELNKEDEGAYSTQVTDLHVYAKQIAEGLGPLVSSFKGSQTPMSEIEAELERLKASDPAFQTCATSIRELMVEKEVFAERIADLMQQISSMATSISQDMLAVVALNDNISENSLKINDRAFMYIKEMERRAKDRLLKYQYYVMKAFEYRMLRAYGGELDLNRLFDAFETLVDPGDHLLTEDEFGLLKSVYVEELSRITAEMFDELNTRPPERSVPITFALSDAELEQLNRDGSVRINMRSKNIFGRTEENIRIVDLRTASLDVHPATGGAYGGTALLRLKYEHSGMSLLGSQGKMYTFNHYRAASTNPITWKTVYDDATHEINETEISASSQSLLRFLIEDQLGQSNPDLMLYSLPAAYADIVITKEEVTETGEKMIIDSLRLEVQYEYAEKRRDQSELEVRVTSGLAPTIWIESPDGDVNGRRDGRGDFVRVFSRGESVRLEAPATYGTWAFARWADPSGQVLKALSNLPTTTVNMNAHKMIQAVYIDLADTTPPAAPVITTNGGADFITGFSTVTLAGAVEPDVNTIEVNGSEIPYEMGELNWQVDVNLAIGAQALQVVAFDETYNASEPATIVVTFIPAYDSDSDGMIDSNEGLADPDGDGIPNYLDADSDDDEMPDKWEWVSGTDPYVDDADQDPDDDGASNYLEYRYHTDPNDPLSFPGAANLSVDRIELTLSEASPSGTLHVVNLGELPLAWSASAGDAAVTISPQSGTGPGIVTVTATSFEYDRDVNVVFSNNNDPSDTETVVLHVQRTERPADLSVSTNLITLMPEMPSATFNVLNFGDGGLEWTASSSNQAVTIEPANGAGAAPVTVICSSFMQEATVNVVVGNEADPLDWDVVIVQIQRTPVPGGLDVSTNLLTLTGASSASAFNVFDLGVESIGWSVSANTTTVAVDPASGAEPGAVAVAGEDLLPGRECKLTIENTDDADDTETVVVQKLDTAYPTGLDVSTRLVTLTSGSPSAALNIFSLGAPDVGWTVLSSDAAVTVDPQTGSGAASVVLSASSFTDDLTVDVTVRNSDDPDEARTVVVQVLSTPIPGGLDVSANVLTLNGMAPSGTVNILRLDESNANWSAVSDSDAVEVEPGSGAGLGAITVRATDFSRDLTATVNVANVESPLDTETIVVHIQRTLAPADLEVDTNSMTLAEGSPTGVLHVMNTGELPLRWTISCDNPAVTAAPAQGIGPAAVTVSATGFSHDATATLMVANQADPSDTEAVVVLVQHTAVEGDLVVDKDCLTLSRCCPTSAFHVLSVGDSPASWSIWCDSELVSVSPQSGDGPALITVSAEQFRNAKTVHVVVTNVNNAEDSEIVHVRLKKAPIWARVGCGSADGACSEGASDSVVADVLVFLVLALTLLLADWRSLGSEGDAHSWMTSPLRACRDLCWPKFWRS
jgi:hypothetical protein